MAPKLRDGPLGCMRHGRGCFDVVGRSSGGIAGSRPQNFLKIIFYLAGVPRPVSGRARMCRHHTTWTAMELESHSCDSALVNGGGCVALITALGEKGDLPHPIALDYAATGT